MTLVVCKSEFQRTDLIMPSQMLKNLALIPPRKLSQSTVAKGTFLSYESHHHLL